MRESGTRIRGHGGTHPAATIAADVSRTHAGNFACDAAGSSILEAILIISGKTGWRHVHDVEGNPGATDHQNLPGGTPMSAGRAPAMSA
jgi:hypothetical protein